MTDPDAVRNKPRRRGLFCRPSIPAKTQAEYVVWRDRVVGRGGDRKSKFRNRNLDPLPDADPGNVIAHRWRKKFCTKGEIDQAKIETKIRAQAEYVVWRDGVVAMPSERGKLGGRGKKLISVQKSALPAADPGEVIAHKWRKRF